MSSSFRSSSIFYCLIQACFFCSEPVTGCMVAERLALIQFRSSLKDPENRLFSWRGSECCSWRGVSCDNLTLSVTAINLRNPYPNAVSSSDFQSHGFWNLSGKIDPSLIQLKSLERLDLSYNTFEGIRIPSFLGSLKELRYLNLSEAGFSGLVPPQLGNLSRLQYLDLSSSFPQLVADDLQWASGLSSLEFLSMNSVDLSMAGSEWFQGLNRLSFLRELHLSGCIAAGIAETLPLVNLTSLRVLDLSFNSFNSAIPNWFSNLSSLVHMDLSNTAFRGQIPELSRISGLKYMDMSMNHNLTADISELLGGNWRQIESIQLESNRVFGFLPDSIGNLTSLVELNLFDNAIEGGIPSSIGKICSLKSLILDGNNLTLGLPRSLEVEGCSSDKPLQNLDFFSASLNEIGGGLPEWLGELKNLTVLNLAYNMIAGPVPPYLGNLSLITELELDGNKLNGTLPSTLGYLSKLKVLGVSSNKLTGSLNEELFSGPIPMPSSQVELLDLSNNQFSGPIPSSIGYLQELQIINLSNNHFAGSIPSGFQNCSYLKALVLDHNSLSGLIPPSLGSLVQLQSLHLSNNGLSGPIPQSLQNCTNLETINLGNNNINSSIPAWLGNKLPALRILVLRSNKLIGQIPFQHFGLQSLQVLDLANNQLSGTIPLSFGSFKAMNSTFKRNLNLHYGHYRGTYYQESISIHSNNGQLTYSKTLSLVTSIDLSQNRLSGEIPETLTDLSGLHILNLFENNLTGKIPPNIGRMQLLEILDLSNNHLSGEIPATMSFLTFLSRLNLSYNNFSGRIPSDGHFFTFLPSSFTGNRFICGLPLGNNCEESSNDRNVNDDDDLELVDEWFYMSAGLGYAMGLLGLIAGVSIRRSWCDTYLEFLDWLIEKVTKTRRHTRPPNPSLGMSDFLIR